MLNLKYLILLKLQNSKWLPNDKCFHSFRQHYFSALLAWTSFGIWIGLNPKSYSPTTYIEQPQNLVSSLNSLMVSLVILATLVTALSAFLNRKHKTIFIALLFASIFLASCIFVSRFGNFPIQIEVLTWKAEHLSDNWTSLRDKWWALHIMWAIAELLALVLVAWVSVHKISTERLA
jgi:hypothetical protein